ncbi:MAG: DHA2 family efflux MFS transporter permease subunit [Candidatus Dormibacterales bacterium]
MTATQPNRRPIAAVAVLSLGLFMTLLDVTIVNVAIPSLTAGLHATLDQVLWVLNAYSLPYAVLLITGARLGDVFGPRNLFAAGLAVFTAASALSGLAHGPEQLIVARALQGLGAALAAPQGLPVMLELFAVDKRGGAFAVFGTLSGLAVLAGPTAGGFIVTHFGWRWIFYLNVPVGLLTIALALRFVPDLRPGRRHRFDMAGLGLATLGLVGVVFGLIEGQRYSWGALWGPVTIPQVIAAGALMLGLFLVQQARRQGREPLLPFALFTDRNFALMTVVMAGMGFALLGFYLPLTIYLQSVLGLPAVAAGLTIAPQPLAMMVASGASANLIGKVPGKYLLVGGLAAFAAGMAYVDWALAVDAGRWLFVPGLVISGAGLGFVWTPAFSLGTRDLTPELGGAASGVINTIMELGGVVAGGAVGALLQNRLALALHGQAVRYSAHLPTSARNAFVGAFQEAARHGLQVGAGQSGTAVPAPLRVLAHEVFGHAFVDAARLSALVPIAVVLLAALACLPLRRDPRPAGARAGIESEAEPAA